VGRREPPLFHVKQLPLPQLLREQPASTPRPAPANPLPKVIYTPSVGYYVVLLPSGWQRLIPFRIPTQTEMFETP